MIPLVHSYTECAATGIPHSSALSVQVGRTLRRRGRKFPRSVEGTGHLRNTSAREPVFAGAADFDLELFGSRTLDGNIQELVYRPTPHT